MYAFASDQVFSLSCLLIVHINSDRFFQNLKTEKQMVEKIENEVSKVRAELTTGGHRPDDISRDTGALTTELAKKNRELVAKVKYGVA